ncbi:LUD domain-containing protein [Pedobacter sp. P351]|uniref:LutC/YkgG family protein n=1 Tax=Pedobacter superstes TaxID=3133441 RepID=UPI0030A4E6B1
MSSRDKILAAVKANQPELIEIPVVNIPQSTEGLSQRFTAIATAIGSKVIEVSSIEEIKEHISGRFNNSSRIISSFTELSDIAETEITKADPHTLENVDLAILKAEIAVAENGALWVPEENTMQRVLPFITQHIALVVKKDSFVPTMHQAYKVIGDRDYGYSAFIAGPSKTADIEQSLVLGAHGPRSMTVFILN